MLARAYDTVEKGENKKEGKWKKKEWKDGTSKTALLSKGDGKGKKGDGKGKKGDGKGKKGDGKGKKKYEPGQKAMCRNWQHAGKCDWGDKCKFNHSTAGESSGGSAMFTQGAQATGQKVLPGDWTCPKCSVNNFASRTECFKCKCPKSAGSGAQAGPAG